jgi:hypothetical protein
MAKNKKYYKGEGGGFPQIQVVVNLVSPHLLVACSCTKSALTLINLLFGLCKSMWVINLLFTLLNPYPIALARPSTPELLRAKEYTLTFHSSVVFTLDSHYLSLLRSLCRNLNLKLTTKARACKGVGQKWSPTVTFHVPRSVGECEGMNPHTPKWTPTLGVEVLMDPQIFKEGF